MPMPGFLTSLADKATAAVPALAGHIPGATQPSDQSSANQAAAQGGQSNLTLETIHHQLRQLGQQYS